MAWIDIFRLITAAGLACFIGFMITAIWSQSEYEDKLPAAFFILAWVLVSVGAIGWFVMGET